MKNDSGPSFSSLFTYRGCLGDISYFDQINALIYKTWCELHPKDKLGFVKPLFVIQSIQFPDTGFTNSNLSGNEFLSKLRYISDRYYPFFKDAEYEKAMENSYVDTDTADSVVPDVVYAPKETAENHDTVNKKGLQYIIIARMSNMIWKILSVLKKNNPEFYEEFSKTVIGEKVSDILEETIGKSATLSVALDSWVNLMEKRADSQGTRDQLELNRVYSYLKSILRQVEDAVKMEMSPKDLFLHNRIVYIKYNIYLDYDKGIAEERKKVARGILEAKLDFYKSIDEVTHPETSIIPLINDLLESLDH